MALLLSMLSAVAGCSSSGGAASAASVGSTVPAVSTSAASVPASTVVAGHDNSGGSGGSGGGSGGSGKNGGGSGSGGTATVTLAPGTVDVIKVTKCWSNGPQLLIKASSSDPLAQLYAYRPDGSTIGMVQNGGSNRYGGTVYAGQPSDPGEVTIKSSSGGSITVKTSPFQPEP
jgi:hypothetical protein